MSNPSPLMPYIRSGFYLVRTRAEGKLPSNPNWQRKVPHGGKPAGTFLAYDTAQATQQRGRCVLAVVPAGVGILDFDRKDETADEFGRKVSETLETLGIPQDTPRVRTPSGGCHIPFRPPEGVRLSTVAKFGADKVWCDVRTHTQPDSEWRTGTHLVVTAGSTSKKGTYSWEGEGWQDIFLNAPEVTVERLKAADERLVKDGNSDPGTTMNTPSDLTEKDLEELLGCLPIAAFKDNQSWATILWFITGIWGGKGRAIAESWCAEDWESYDEDAFDATWESRLLNGDPVSRNGVVGWLRKHAQETSDIPGWNVEGVAEVMGRITEFGRLSTGSGGSGGAGDTPPPPPPLPSKPASWWADNEKWTILGYSDEGSIHFAIKETRAHLVFRKNAGPTDFLGLEPSVDWWKDTAGININTLNSRIKGHSALYIAARQVGHYDEEKVQTAGAWSDKNGGVWFHTGDGVIDPQGERHGFGQKGGAICPPNLPLGVEHRDSKSSVSDWSAAMSRYRWDTPKDGENFIGWAVCSILCGALDWRPALWLTGERGSGKSWLTGKKVMGSVYGEMLPMSRKLAGNTTEAAVARLTRPALPLVIDEGEAAEMKALEGLLMLVRQTSDSSSGRTVADRSNQDGTVTVVPRSAVMLMGTTRAELGPADKSRISIIALSKTPVENWPEVQAAIESACAKGADIRGTVIKYGHEIKANIEAAQQIAIAASLDMREAQQVSSLVGAACWAANPDNPTKKLAETMAAHMVEEAPEKSTVIDLLAHLVSVRLDLNGAPGRKSVGRMLAEGPGGSSETRLREFGMMWLDGKIAINPKSPQLVAHLRGSIWESVSIGSVLLDLEGAYKQPREGKRPRLGGSRRLPILFPPEHIGETGDTGSTGDNGGEEAFPVRDDRIPEGPPPE